MEDEDNQSVEIKTFWYVKWGNGNAARFQSVKCRLSYGVGHERVFETIENDPHFGEGYFLSECADNGCSPDKAKVFAYWRRKKATDNNSYLKALEQNIKGIKRLEAMV